jgi:hypothetical protein
MAGAIRSQPELKPLIEKPLPFAFRRSLLTGLSFVKEGGLSPP